LKSQGKPVLKGLFFENFQAIKDPTFLRIAPLTLLYGPNSVGKSAVGDALEFLSQLTDPRSPHLLSFNVPAYTQSAHRIQGGKTFGEMTLGFQFHIPANFSHPTDLSGDDTLNPFEQFDFSAFQDKCVSVQFHASDRSSLTLSIAIENEPILEISSEEELRGIDIRKTHLDEESIYEIGESYDNCSITFFDSFWDVWWGENGVHSQAPSKSMLSELAIDEIVASTPAEATYFRKLKKSFRVHGLELSFVDWHLSNGVSVGAEHVPLELLSKNVDRELGQEYRQCWATDVTFSDGHMAIYNEVADPSCFFFYPREWGLSPNRELLQGLRKSLKARNRNKASDSKTRTQYARLAGEFSEGFCRALIFGTKALLNTGNAALRRLEVEADRKLLTASDTFRTFANTGSIYSPPFKPTPPSLINSYIALGCKSVRGDSTYSTGFYYPIESLLSFSPFESDSETKVKSSLDKVSDDLARITSSSGKYRPVFEPYEIREAFDRFPHVENREREVYGYFCHLRLRSSSGALFELDDVGSGISYVLPVLVALRIGDKNCYIHQPELHMHPRAQLELAEVIWDSISSSSVRILETHSEHILLRIKKIIRERLNGNGEDSLPSAVLTIICFEQANGRTVAKEVRLNHSGGFIDRWPGGFFSERLHEIL